MFDSKFNHEARFFADGYELSGIESVSFSYNATPNILKPLGTKDGITTHAGPIQQTMALSRVLTYDDPVFAYTGDASLSGSIYYEDDYSYFNSGYLTDYSLNCAVGTVPRVSCNFQIADEVKNFNSDEERVAEFPTLETHPTIDIPTQGSITISCDNSQTNRVVGFDYGVKCKRKAYITIGNNNIQKIELLPPVEFTASVQIEVDDAFLQDSYKFLEEKENKSISISVDGRDGSLIQSLQIPNASLVSENLQVSADGAAKITLNYVGHSAKEEAEAISSDITYVFDETGGIYDSTSSTTIPFEAYKENSNVYGLQVGDNVTKIDGRAFQGCDNLNGDLYINMEAQVPPVYSFIEYGAFKDCSGFDGTLIIEEGLQKIGYGAFQNSSLKGNLILPDSIIEMQDLCFKNCANFRGLLRLPKSELTIGKSAFENCSGLKGDLTIPDGVQEGVGRSTFRNCSGFDGNLYLGTGIKILDAFSFTNCNSLKGDLVMPPNLTGIKGSVFFGCNEFDGKLTLNSGLEYIGTSAFAQCHQISSDLVIPDSVYAIDDYAFNSCRNLKSLTIGTGLDWIGAEAFKGCSSLAGDIDFKNVRNIYKKVFQDVSGIGRLTFGPIETIGESAFERCKGVNGDLIFPDSLTSLGVSAFNDCQNLDGDLVIGNGITRVYNKTFANTFFDGGLTLGQNITQIDEEAFRTAGFTNQLVLPDSIEKIKYRAFENCGFTGDLVLHSGIQTVEGRAFKENRSIKRVIVDFPRTRFVNFNQFNDVGKDVGGAALYANERDYYGYLEDPSSETQLYKSFRGLPIRRGALESRVYKVSDDSIIKYTNTDIPDAWFNDTASAVEGYPDVYIDVGLNASEIGLASFRDNTGLRGNIFIPETIKTIKGEAFRGCTGLTGSLYFEEGLEYMEEYAFRDCSNITGDLILPDSLKSVQRQIFRDCYGLNGSLKIGKGLTQMSNNIFYQCSNITGAIDIPSGIKTINQGSFFSCSGFNSLDLKPGLETIANLSFKNCVNIGGSVLMPNTLKIIGNQSFRNCPSISSVDFGNTVESIGIDAFRECSGISSITLKNNITYVGGGAFRDCPNVQFAYIDVPTGAIKGVNTLRFVDDGSATSDRILYVSEQYYTDYLTASTTTLGGGTQGYFQGNLISIDPDDKRSTTYFDASFNAVDSVLGDVPNAWKENDTNGSYLYIGSKTKNIGEAAFRHANQTSNLSGTLLLPYTLEKIYSSSSDGAFARTEFSSLASQEGIKEIQDYAFAECHKLKTVVLPGTLEYLGEYAFEKNAELQRLKIGNNETRVRKTILDTKAFYLCGTTSPKEGVVELGYTVDKIGDYCFANGTIPPEQDWIETLNSSARHYGKNSFSRQRNLINLNLTEDALYIDEKAFEYCTSLTDVVLPNPNYVQAFAFQYCTGITSLSIGNDVDNPVGRLEALSLKYIGIQDPSVSICDVYVGSSIDYIGEGAFSAYVNSTYQDRFKYIKSAEINARRIDKSAFSNQRNMTGITFGDTVKVIGRDADEGQSFIRCYGLKDITIPDPENIWYYAFNYCTGITGISIGNDEKNTQGRIEASAFRRVGPPTQAVGSIDLYVGSSIDLIGESAFSANNDGDVDRYRTIKKATINARQIYKHCFYRQTNMTGVTFGETVKVIGKDFDEGESFYDCDKLKDITIPDPEAIYHYAFNYCTGITGISIGNDEKDTQGRIEASAFRRVGPINPVSTNGKVYIGSSISYVGNYAFSADNDSAAFRYRWIKDLEINSREIAKETFWRQRLITGIKFGDGVKVIGVAGDENSRTFYDNYELKEIKISDPENIYGRAFQYCTGTTGVYIGNNERNTQGRIHNQAFRNVGTNTTNGHLYVGSSISDIGYESFRADATWQWIQSADLNCKTIGFAALGEHSNMTELTFSSGVKNIGVGNGAGLGQSFYQCYGLTGVTIPDPENIWHYSFDQCTSITGVYIGNDTEDTKGRVQPNAFRSVGTTAQGNAGNGHLYVGSSIQKLDSAAFYGDFYWIYSADINCEEIGYQCFEQQRNLKELTFSSGVKTIASRAFYDNYALTGIRIPDPSFINDYAFQYTYGITGTVHVGNDTEDTKGVINNHGFRYMGPANASVGTIDLYVGSSIEYIGSNAFDAYLNSSNPGYFRNIKSANLNCETIGYQAFYNQDNLTGVTLSSGVKYIGVPGSESKSFDNCEGLRELRIPDPKHVGPYAAIYAQNISGLYIGNETEDTKGVIKYHAFTHLGLNYRGQGHVYIGSSIDLVENLAFYDSSDYNHIKTLDVRCREIQASNNADHGVFRNQRLMTDVSFSSGVKVVGDYAFNYCYELTGVRIPDPELLGGGTLKGGLFRLCNKLTGVYIGNDTENTSGVIKQRALSDRLGEGSLGLGHLYIGSSIDRIEYDGVGGYWNGSTYFGRPWLKSADLKCREFGEIAFTHQVNMTGVKFSDDCRVFGNYSFEYCTKLSSVVIPGATDNASDETLIGEQAFRYASDLDYVNIGFSDGRDGGTIVDANAFRNCGLNKIGVGYVALGRSVRAVKDYAFYGDHNWIQKASVNCYSVGPNAFAEQRELDDLVFGWGLREISGNAFGNCTSLTGPLKFKTSRLRNIESGAFEGCPITDVYLNTEQSSIHSGAFPAMSASGKFYVTNDKINTWDSTFNGRDVVEWTTYPDTV